MSARANAEHSVQQDLGEGNSVLVDVSVPA